MATASHSTKFIDLTGERYGRLTVLQQAENKCGHTAWTCLCDCGKLSVIKGGSLRDGRTQSCGCLNKEVRAQAFRTHGLSTVPEYNIWHLMRARCFTTSNPAYAGYGGRSITVCHRWRSFPAFYKDMGPRLSPHHSIDRINNNAHYSCGRCKECRAHGWPANCRWTTKKIQQRNTRKNHLIHFQGKTQCLTAWAEELHISLRTLEQRLHAGWSEERALAMPVRKMTRRTHI